MPKKSLPAVAQVTILSRDKTQQQVNYLSRTATGFPSRIQWTAPGGSHYVDFPAGVFEGGAVHLQVSGSTPQPAQPLTLLDTARPEDEDYPDYIDVEAASAQPASATPLMAAAQPMNRANPPIIIVKA